MERLCGFHFVTLHNLNLKKREYRLHQTRLRFILLICGIFLMYGAFSLSFRQWIVLIMTAVPGFFYSFFFYGFKNKLYLKNKATAGMKSSILLYCWLMMTVFFPSIDTPQNWDMVWGISLLYASWLLINMLIFDLRDYQTDIDNNRRSLISGFSKQNATRLIIIANLLIIFFVIPYASEMVLLKISPVMFVPNLGYFLFLIGLYYRQDFFSEKIYVFVDILPTAAFWWFLI